MLSLPATLLVPSLRPLLSHANHPSNPPHSPQPQRKATHTKTGSGSSKHNTRTRHRHFTHLFKHARNQQQERWLVGQGPYPSRGHAAPANANTSASELAPPPAASPSLHGGRANLGARPSPRRASASAQPRAGQPTSRSDDNAGSKRARHQGRAGQGSSKQASNRQER